MVVIILGHDQVAFIEKWCYIMGGRSIYTCRCSIHEILFEYRQIILSCHAYLSLVSLIESNILFYYENLILYQ